MKTKIINKRAEQGQVLLVTLLICLILGTGLVSYLVMIQAQNRSVFRSQTWNHAIALTEAGVEEGMTHLNSVESLDALASNGWTAKAGGGFASPRRYLGANYYDVSITVPNDGQPLVSCIGTVNLQGPYVYAPQAMFAQINRTEQYREPTLARSVEAKTRVDGLLTVTMAAIRQIDFSGKNVETDSFNSTDPNYSSGSYVSNKWVGYYDPNKRRDHGDICTDYTITNSLSVGNAKIRGVARTGPTGTITLGPNGAVGDAAWVDSGTKGLQAGHFFDDFNVSFPPVKLPSMTWMPPAAYTGGPINGVQYSYVLPAGNWVLSQLNGAVLVTGPANLYVTDKINLTGTKDQIRILNTNNASLKLYMSGATTSIAGNGVVNESNIAINFQYLGLPSNTSASFGANAYFCGCIYCPSAAFTLGGGGNNTYDFVGASVSYTVKMNGHFKFHYDEALLANGPGRGFIIVNWREL